jgi:hypothetical protein
MTVPNYCDFLITIFDEYYKNYDLIKQFVENKKIINTLEFLHFFDCVHDEKI